MVDKRIGAIPWMSPTDVSVHVTGDSYCGHSILPGHISPLLCLSPASPTSVHPSSGLPASLPASHGSRRGGQDNIGISCLEKTDLGTSSHLRPPGRLSGWKGPDSFFHSASCLITLNGLRTVEEGTLCWCFPNDCVWRTIVWYLPFLLMLWGGSWEHRIYIKAV